MDFQNYLIYNFKGLLIQLRSIRVDGGVPLGCFFPSVPKDQVWLGWRPNQEFSAHLREPSLWSRSTCTGSWSQQTEEEIEGRLSDKVVDPWCPNYCCVFLGNTWSWACLCKSCCCCCLSRGHGSWQGGLSLCSMQGPMRFNEWLNFIIPCILWVQLYYYRSSLHREMKAKMTTFSQSALESNRSGIWAQEVYLQISNAKLRASSYKIIKWWDVKYLKQDTVQDYNNLN